MKNLKTFLIGIIVGALLGAWLGYNKGRGVELFSNPFQERTVSERIKSTVGEGVEKAGQSIEKLGEDIKGTMDK